MPTEKEVKSAAIGLSRNSTGGPDGMERAFYENTWAIVGGDVYNMEKSSFCGTELPKFITHTNLALLIKKMIKQNC